MFSLHRHEVSLSKFELSGQARDVIESGEGYQLRESPAPYKAFFEPENKDIDLENTRF
jgi:hypothetical protein